MPSLNTEKILTCLEHKILKRQNFEHPNDFDFLLNQNLPCFEIKYHQGELSLSIKSFLTLILLPSGWRLEILPKITPLKEKSDLSTQKNAVMQSRKWVNLMLSRLMPNSIKIHTLANFAPNSPQDYFSPQDYLDNSIHNNSIYNYSIHTMQNSNQKKIQDKDKNQGDIITNWSDYLYQNYVACLENIIKNSPKEYIKKSQNAPNAKGKIKPMAQLKNAHRPHFLVTEQQILQADSLLWQFLATAYWQLVYLIPKSRFKISPTLQQMLNRYQKNPIAIGKWQASYTRIKQISGYWRSQQSNYQMEQIYQALEWAFWLLNLFVYGIGTQTDLNQNYFNQNKLPLNTNHLSMPPCYAIMINMAHAFESWVSLSIQDWLNQIHPHYTLKIQPSFLWLRLDSMAIMDKQDRSDYQSAGRKLQPDLCIFDENDHPMIAIDVKYKSIQTPLEQSLKDLDRSDLFQLYAYQHHLQCKEVWLIYPNTPYFYQSYCLVESDLLGSFNYFNHSDDRLKSCIKILPFILQTGQLQF